MRLIFFIILNLSIVSYSQQSINNTKSKNNIKLHTSDNNNIDSILINKNIEINESYTLLRTIKKRNNSKHKANIPDFLLDSIISYEFNTENDSISIYKELYKYDLNDSLVQKERYSWNSELNSWTGYDKYDYSYDNNGNIIKNIEWMKHHYNP